MWLTTRWLGGTKCSASVQFIPFSYTGICARTYTYMHACVRATVGWYQSPHRVVQLHFTDGALEMESWQHNEYSRCIRNDGTKIRWLRKLECRFSFNVSYSLKCANGEEASNFGRLLMVRGTAVAQWLRCCATIRKIAGSIPNGVIGIFHWHNPSDRTMNLGSIQPLKGKSTRRISWG